MTLKFTNTFTRRKEPFKPLRAGNVTIYCCGVTVYDLCHLGHARSYISWDVLRRYLIWSGYKVLFVQNFTDIDDKILAKSSEEGVSIDEITSRNITAFFEDMDALGIKRPDSMPRATKSLDSIRNFISELQRKGSAYSIEGDVYFSVDKFPAYGKLSRRDLTSQIKNADGRVDKDQESRKQGPFDFALWKRSNDGELSYESPWGPGRPGWHIECSAMVRDELGDSIDIHLGGADLIFPHHENEIAQSQSVTGKQLATYWLHNGMVNVDGQKMSKSLGNFTTIRALLNTGVSPMSVRLFVLQAHYRKPIDFTKEAIKAANSGWKRLNSALLLGIKYSEFFGLGKSEINNISTSTIGIKNSFNSNELSDKELIEARQAFSELMDDDLNTSGALSVLFDLARPLTSLFNRLERFDDVQLSKEQISKTFLQWQLLVELSSILGLNIETTDDSLSSQESSVDESYINKMISDRNFAKQNSDYDEADRIRTELRGLGIDLIDKPGGITDWIRSN